MIKEAPNINHLWASLIVEELVRCGIRHFFIAPGSRSTPLVTSIARHSLTHPIIHYDERGTAYAALGCARATHNPVVWVTTSGTALANGLPAVIEAHQSNIPLILLTADRPPELRQSGANQTMNQLSVFTPYVNWMVDGAPPTIEIAPSYVLTTIDHAVHRASSGSKGPVHINWMFREPLAPEPTNTDFADYFDCIGAWINGSQRYTSYPTVKRSVHEAQREPTWNEWGEADAGLLIIGRLEQREEGEASLDLARQLGWPVYADINSQIRLGNLELAHDVLITDDYLFEDHRAEQLGEELKVIIQLGKWCISKRLAQWINKARPNHFVLVDEFSGRIDPLHNVTMRVEGSIMGFCQLVRDHLSHSRPQQSQWNSQWESINKSIRKSHEQLWEAETGLSEPMVARLISTHIPEGQGLVIGNSMPVRDMNVHASYRGKWAYVMSNRGVSGIDGTIATATGFACGSNQTVTVLIGDLALIHDLNSLALLRTIKQQIVVVVINNNGGGIFSFLPIAHYEDVFEEYFGTPHTLQFKSAADLFGLSYSNPSTIDEFERVYTASLNASTPALIEVQTNRVENYDVHMDMKQRILRKGVL